MISFEKPSDGNIDWDETTRIQTGKSVPNEEDIESIKKLILQIKKPVFGANQVNGQTTIEEIEPKFFIFEGNDRFDKQLSLLETQSNKKLTDYEASISAELLRKIDFLI
jgi:hypothetical protein